MKTLFLCLVFCFGCSIAVGQEVTIEQDVTVTPEPMAVAGCCQSVVEWVAAPVVVAQPVQVRTRVTPVRHRVLRNAVQTMNQNWRNRRAARRMNTGC